MIGVFSGVPLPFPTSRKPVASDLRGRLSSGRRLICVFTQPGPTADLSAGQRTEYVYEKNRHIIGFGAAYRGHLLVGNLLNERHTTRP